MNTNWIIRIGRFLYGFSMVAVGIHQIIIKDFRPEILPPFPAWAHTHTIFPVLVGIVLVIAGILIAGFYAKKICLFLGSLFLVLIVTCYLPYILFISTEKLTNIVVWFGAGEALAYSGGAFVMAGSYSGKPIPIGRILLRHHKVPVEMRIYPNGGHGFIFRQPGWTEPLFLWMKNNKWIMD